MCLPYKTNSRYESGYECICIVINGKKHSIPLNIFSSVLVNPIFTIAARHSWAYVVFVTQQVNLES